MPTRGKNEPDFAKEGSTIVTVTPDMAYDWLTTYKYEHQRPLRQDHVSFLAEAMRRGEFTLSTLRLATFRGETHLLDGQHRLTALFDCGIPQRFAVISQLCNTEEELRRAYYTIDIGMARTLVDAYRGNKELEATGLNDAQIRSVSAATQIILSRFSNEGGGVERSKYAGKSRDERLRQVIIWKNEAKSFFDATHGGSREMVTRLKAGVVVGVGLITFRHQPALAADFWRKVAMNDGLARLSPEGRLAHYLLVNRFQRTGLKLYARTIAAHWNARYNGREEVKNLPVRRDTEPMLIEGTPWDGSI